MENNEERNSPDSLNLKAENNQTDGEGLSATACCASSFLEDSVFRGVWNNLDELCGENQGSREMIKSALDELWVTRGSKAYEDDPDYDVNQTRSEIESLLSRLDPRDLA